MYVCGRALFFMEILPSIPLGGKRGGDKTNREPLEATQLHRADRERWVKHPFNTPPPLVSITRVNSEMKIATVVLMKYSHVNIWYTHAKTYVWLRETAFRGPPPPIPLSFLPLPYQWPWQDILLKELVYLTDALARETNHEATQSLKTLIQAPLSPVRIVKALAENPLDPLLAPFQVTAK